MSRMAYQLSALNDPDPFGACFWGVDEHPRYHDCLNCEHAKSFTETCKPFILQKIFEAENEENDRLIREIEEFCNRDYSIEDGCYVPNINYDD